jgi:glutamate dehydrogenase (NADP+)
MFSMDVKIRSLFEAQYIAFELFVFMQTLKNALSLYKLGGAAGGSDFDPKGKSESEVLVLYFISFMQ